MLKTFCFDILPVMLKEYKYEYVENISYELLGNENIGNNYKKNVYLCLIKALHDQLKEDELNHAKIEFGSKYEV